MKLCDELHKCSFSPNEEIVVALGVFDGLHLAHQQIIDECKRRAKARQGKSLIFTFQNHPMSILAPESAPKLLTPFPLKQRLMEKNKVDVLMAIPFDLEFSRLSAQDFIEKVLIHQLNAKEVVVGFNFHFGFQRKGHAAMLKDYVPTYFDAVTVFERQVDNDLLISSTLIRESLKKGELEFIRSLLGRTYQLGGKVVKGDGRGSSIGFPTANLDVDNQALPPSGVYGVQVHIDELDAEPIWGMMNIGRVPTFTNQTHRRVEVHLLNQNINLYDHYLIVNFITKVREEMKFDSPKELVNQIHQDISFFSENFIINKP